MSPFGVRVHTLAARARADAAEFLAADPYLGNVIATTTEGLCAGVITTADPLWVCVLDGADGAGSLVGVAMHTPPYGVALSAMPAPAAEVAAREMYALGRDLPMASGPDPGLTAFVSTWTALTDRSVGPSHDLAVFALDRVVDLPAPPPGALRPAGPEDRDLLTRWAVAFGTETGVLIGDPAAFAERVLARPALFVWDAGEPVCMVAHTPAGAEVVRVGPVYTPPQWRRRGYAGAATAAVSRAIVAAGHRAMLFADLANPSANNVYRRIGYHQVALCRDVRFTGD